MRPPSAEGLTEARCHGTTVFIQGLPAIEIFLSIRLESGPPLSLIGVWVRKLLSGSVGGSPSGLEVLC